MQVISEVSCMILV